MTTQTVSYNLEQVFADNEPEMVAPLVRQLALIHLLIVLGRTTVSERAALEAG